MCSSLPVNAIESIDLRMKGQILPSACLAFFDDGGVVDYGNINTRVLPKDKYKLLDIKNIKFNILCGELTKVGFTLIAGRLNTLANPRNKENSYGFGVPGPNTTLAGTHGALATGIGLDAKGNRIGGVVMDLKGENLIVDGENRRIMIFLGKNLTISREKIDIQESLMGGYIYSAGNIGENGGGLLAFKSWLSTLDVQAYINMGRELDLSQEINLDGLVTFELYYF